MFRRISELAQLLKRALHTSVMQLENAGYGISQSRYHPHKLPIAPWRNAVLRDRNEWEAAVVQANQLSLPVHRDRPKNWDSLAMIACVLERTHCSARILEAGAMPYSTLLPSLSLYGYRDLVGVDLSYGWSMRRGPIRYEHGDITRLKYSEASFDVILCQSVLEHGVNVEAFLREAARALSPGGFVMISVDYFAEPVATDHLSPFGMPYRVFTPGDIDGLINSALKLGLYPLDPIDLSCQDRAVRWDKYDLEYTFLILTLVKGTPFSVDISLC
jgi:SAM-dependent methyltransferase